MSTAQVVSYARIVGQSLAWLRQLRNLDQAHVANHVGVNQPTWSKIERGDLALSIEQLSRAADVLGSTPSNILQTADAGVARLRAQGVHVVATRSDPELSGAALILSVAVIALLIAGTMRS